MFSIIFFFCGLSILYEHCTIFPIISQNGLVSGRALFFITLSGLIFAENFRFSFLSKRELFGCKIFSDTESPELSLFLAANEGSAAAISSAFA